jgi:hypothetical protein
MLVTQRHDIDGAFQTGTCSETGLRGFKQAAPMPTNPIFLITSVVAYAPPVLASYILWKM